MLSLLADKLPNHDLFVNCISYILEEVVNCYQFSTTTTKIVVGNLPATLSSNSSEPNLLDTYKYLIRCVQSAEGLANNISYYLDLPHESILQQ